MKTTLGARDRMVLAIAFVGALGHPVLAHSANDNCANAIPLTLPL